MKLTFADAKILSEALTQFIENTPEWRGEFETEADAKAVATAEKLLEQVNSFIVEATGTNL